MLSKNRIKQIQALQLKKSRDLQRLFIAEGKKTVEELVNSQPELVTEIIATTEFANNNQNLFSDTDVLFTEASDEEFKKISQQASPAGILAVCHYFKEVEKTFDFKTNFSFYLDDIRDPGNFGTIVRLADWFGVKNIFCSPKSCDQYNPKVIQSTMGAFLRVHVVYTELSALIKDQNVKTIYGAVLDGKNVYREKLQPGLIVIGNEANGIGDDNLNLINEPVTIPANQNNGTESLNAAMAASILASEFFRQLKN